MKSLLSMNVRLGLDNQLPHLTQDAVWERDKNTRKHHIQKNQEASPFPTDDLKTARRHQKKLHFMYYVNNGLVPSYIADLSSLKVIVILGTALDITTTSLHHLLELIFH